MILPASQARLSIAPDRPIFSLPAKSTRFNLPTLTISSFSIVDSLIWTVIVNIVCERLK